MRRDIKTHDYWGDGDNFPICYSVIMKCFGAGVCWCLCVCICVCACIGVCAPSHEGVVRGSRPGHVADGPARHPAEGGVEAEREGQGHSQSPDTHDHHLGGSGRQARLQGMDDGHVPVQVRHHRVQMSENKVQWSKTSSL